MRAYEKLLAKRLRKEMSTMRSKCRAVFVALCTTLPQKDRDLINAMTPEEYEEFVEACKVKLPKARTPKVEQRDPYGYGR